MYQEMERLLKNFTIDQKSTTKFLIQSSTSPFCFYPGSFNPWHQGHTSCVSLHLKYFPEVPLMVLPDHNPHKDLKIDHDLIKLPPEIAQVHVGAVFRQKLQTNPTYHWVSYIKKHCPNLQLGLLLGLDSYLNLPKWYNYQELLNCLSFLEVIPREIDNLAANKAQFTLNLKHLAPKLEIHLIEENPFGSVSSTFLRQK